MTHFFTRKDTRDSLVWCQTPHSPSAFLSPMLPPLPRTFSFMPKLPSLRPLNAWLLKNSVCKQSWHREIVGNSSTLVPQNPRRKNFDSCLLCGRWTNQGKGLQEKGGCCGRGMTRLSTTQKQATVTSQGVRSPSASAPSLEHKHTHGTHTRPLWTFLKMFKTQKGWGMSRSLPYRGQMAHTRQDCSCWLCRFPTSAAIARQGQP